MSLQTLEVEILTLHSNVNLRNTLTGARQIGAKLQEAKSLMKHGQWLPWLKRVGISRRLAALYMQLAREDPPEPTVSLNKFLGLIRRANKLAAQARVAEQRALAVAADARTVPTYKVVHADCRKYKWPAVVDVIATDPVWDDIDAYRWLGTFAGRHLKPGGLLVVQVSQYKLAETVQALAGAGLQYVWSLALVFNELHLSKNLFHPFQVCWRPVQVWCNGHFPRDRFASCSDTYTVGCHGKQYHDWEQPLTPWLYWLERLTLPGELIVDPFCGSATVGVALRDIGGRRYIGTDVDPVSVKVARARLKGS
jgi:hypothetical protein